MAETTDNYNDYAAIAATLQHYLNGARSGKGDDMKPAFHEGATIYGYLGPDFIGSPIQALFDWVDENPAATEVESNIASIDIAGTVATVRLELKNWAGHRFTDMFTMLKSDGQWKIISKVFYLHG